MSNEALFIFSQEPELNDKEECKELDRFFSQRECIISDPLICMMYLYITILSLNCTNIINLARVRFYHRVLS